MVVRLRLQRHGRIHLPFYRVAVAHSKRHVTKKVIEYVGTYDPLVDKTGVKHLRLNIPRVKYWLAVGAQPSDTVARLLSNFNLLPPPPRRSTLPADTALLRAMQGGGAEPQPDPATQADAVTAPRNGIKVASLYVSEAMRSAEERRRQRAEQQQAATGGSSGSAAPLRNFPFSIPPTPATFASWQQARQRFNRGRLANAAATPQPPAAAPAAAAESAAQPDPLSLSITVYPRGRRGRGGQPPPPPPPPPSPPPAAAQSLDLLTPAS